jgi:hypothetical protein
VDGHAIGFESDASAGAIRSLIFVYEGEMEAAAAFNALQPAEPAQALPELGTEVYLHEPAGSQKESVVTFRKENMVGSISVRLVSDAMRGPQEIGVELARLTLRWMGD